MSPWSLWRPRTRFTFGTLGYRLLDLADMRAAFTIASVLHILDVMRFAGLGVGPVLPRSRTQSRRWSLTVLELAPQRLIQVGASRDTLWAGYTLAS